MRGLHNLLLEAFDGPIVADPNVLSLTPMLSFRRHSDRTDARRALSARSASTFLSCSVLIGDAGKLWPNYACLAQRLVWP